MDDTAHTDPEHELDRLRSQRLASQARHAQALSALMSEREDLRGVHALADLVADASRWSA